MKRNKIIEKFAQDKSLEHKQRVVFHEAGHAAGIHLNNKARCLPPVFFKIILKDMDDLTEVDSMADQAVYDECIARIEGGRLIEMLLPSVDSSIDALTQQNNDMMELVHDYRLAFEADIINLLIGPLAEARHVAESDGELFNHKLVNLNALKNYGGSSDLALVNEYLQNFLADAQQIDEKLDELFNAAFHFIDNNAHWSAITELADYILGSNTNMTSCEEIVSILDQSVDRFRNRLIKMT